MIALGIGGFILTNILTARGAVAVKEEIEAKEEEKGDQLETKEVIPIAIKNYAAAFVAGILSCGFIFAGNRKYATMQATALTAYGLINTRYRKYRDAVLQRLGISDIKSIEDGIDKVLTKKPVYKTNSKEVYHNGGITIHLHAGDTDIFTETTMEELVQAEYESQHIMSKNGKISMNQFAEFFGVTLGEDGEKYGLNQEYLYDQTGECWIEFVEELDLRNNFYDIYTETPLIVGWDC